MSAGGKVRLPLVGAHAPGRGWRLARRVSQAVALGGLIVAPFLGGWQRLARGELSSWATPSWDLPPWLVLRLPGGDAAVTAHEVNRLVGGGAAFDIVGLPAVDPVLAAIALGAGAVSVTFLLGLLVPVVIGGLAGRVFCGWVCPFGTLSRIVRSVVRRLPIRPPALRIPARRPVRWVLLGVSVGLGVAGFEAVAYLLLPHVLLQQSMYVAWLMGGAGATLGWLLGLLAVGVALGPTLYCATLCPTGATLGLLGRRRLVRVTLASTRACGAHCSLCARACWLGLDPASGDPGPDCDSCARCFEVCPKTNLRVGVGWRARRGAVAIAAVLAPLLVGCSDAEGGGARHPRLVFEARRLVEDVTLSVSIVDLQGVRLDADDPRAQEGTLLSVGIARRSPAPATDGSTVVEAYAGPLVVDLYRANGQAIGRLELGRPNAPRSTPRQRIFRAHLAEPARPGDRLLLRASGWLAEDVAFEVPKDASTGATRFGGAFMAGLLLFAGLGSLSLAIRGPRAVQDVQG